MGVHWLTWPSAPKLWTELARWLARKGAPLVRLRAELRRGTLELDATLEEALERQESQVSLDARIATPSGEIRHVLLDAQGAGHYTAHLELLAEGPYTITLAGAEQSGTLAEHGVVYLANDEFRPAQRPLLLQQLARLTGGRERSTLHGLFQDRLGCWL